MKKFFRRCLNCLSFPRTPYRLWRRTAAWRLFRAGRSKALEDQIQEVRINQKAASGRIKIYTDSESISQNGEQFSAKSPDSGEIRVEPDQAYTDKDHVAAYIHIYRKLPPNYITKAEARSLGWKDKGTLDQVAPGKSIGGDRFSNYEKNPP